MEDSWVARKDELQALARTVDKTVVLMTKDNWFAKFITWVVVLLHIADKETFTKHFAFTTGNFQFYDESWSYYDVLTTLFHETRHTTQFRWCGFGIHPMLGVPLYLILYALLPPFAGLAYVRFWLELDAERFAIREELMRKISVDPRAIINRAEAFGAAVCSVSYLFPWPAKWGIPKFSAMAKAEILAA